jgi:hypothetical protein
MTTPPENKTAQRIRRYLARMEYVRLGHETPREAAQYLVDWLADSGDIDLFPLLLDSLPESIKTEILAYLTDLASVGFAHYTSGVGGRPISEEVLLKAKKRVRDNYAKLGELAGVS